MSLAVKTEDTPIKEEKIAAKTPYERPVKGGKTGKASGGGARGGGGSGKTWTQQDNVQMLMAALQEKPDWNVIQARVFPDRSVSQVRDHWRKLVLPALQNGKVFG